MVLVHISFHKKMCKGNCFFFEEQFNDYFFEKLSTIRGVAVGIKEAEIEFTKIGGLVRYVLELLASSAAHTIPIVGPLLGGILGSVTFDTYDFLEKKNVVKAASKISNEMVQVGEERIRRVVLDTAYELARIFEQQIAFLKTTKDAGKMAVFAVEKIFSVCGGGDMHATVALNEELLVAAVLSQPDASSLADHINALLSDTVLCDTVFGTTWEPNEMFCQVGLRLEGPSGDFTYWIKASSSSSSSSSTPSTSTGTTVAASTSTVPKCGFRSACCPSRSGANSSAKMAFFDQELCVQYQTDTTATTTAATNTTSDAEELSQSEVFCLYRPCSRLVLQSEVDAYLGSPAAPTQIPPPHYESMSFLNYFKCQRNIALDVEVIPVFRNIIFTCDCAGKDFSRCDLSGLTLNDVCAHGADFSHCRLVSAQLRDVDFKDAKLFSADLSGAHLFNCKLQGDTNLVQTNFCGAILGKDTDLSNNVSFGSSKMHGAHIITKLIAFDIAKRMSAQERMIAQQGADVELIMAELDKLSEQVFTSEPCTANSSGGSRTIYNVDQQCVRDYTGRDALLNSVDDFFATRRTEFAMAVVVAAGGVGKTQAALNYIRERRGVYSDRVFWIRSENAAELVTSFRDLARRLCIPMENKDTMEVVKDVHRHLESQRRMLFVFDNAENYSDIQHYMVPASTRHHVLVTSRVSVGWPQSCLIENLGPFSSAEATAYILRTVPSANAADATELANVFGNLPLGLSMCTAFIKEYSYDIPEYLAYYRKYKVAVLQSDIAGNPQVGSVFSTFSLTVDSLAAQYPVAINLLCLCALFHADGIPMCVFDGIFKNQQEMLSALAVLLRHSLISVQQDPVVGRVIGIHRMLQEVLKIKFEDDLQAMLIQSMELLVLQFRSDRSHESTTLVSVEAWIAKDHLLPHAVTLISLYEDIEVEGEHEQCYSSLISAMFSLCIATGNLYDSLCAFSSAMAMYERAKGFTASALNKAEVMVCIADIHFKQGNYIQAMEGYEEGLQIQEKLFGRDHPSVAKSLSNVARVHFKQGDYAKALEGHEAALRIREKLHGHDHLTVASSLKSIAGLYRDQGHHHLALEG